MRTRVSGLANSVNQVLQEYSNYAAETMREDVKAAAQAAKNYLRTKAPKQTGDYRKSWSVKNTRTKSTEAHATVYAGNGEYRLTHLLEHGHDFVSYVSRDGSRKNREEHIRIKGAAKPIPHIEPARDLAEKKLQQDLREHLKGAP